MKALTAEEKHMLLEKAREAGAVLIVPILIMRWEPPC